jgi:predicted lipoprotein with Yx(FWY)xxD motif
MTRLSMTRKALAGLALVAVALAAVAGVAAGKAKKPTLTLKTRTAGSMGKVLANPSSRTLYRLAPETNSSLLCKSSTCLGIWKPLTVASKSTKVNLPTGVSGAVTFVKRGSRWQVSLSRHPLYTFVSDTRAGQANGDGIKSFGGTWHVIKAKAKSGSAPTPAPTPMPGYPPYY